MTDVAEGTQAGLEPSETPHHIDILESTNPQYTVDDNQNDEHINRDQEERSTEQIQSISQKLLVTTQRASVSEVPQDTVEQDSASAVKPEVKCGCCNCTLMWRYQVNTKFC